uniref:Glutamate--cysteine ligase n=1 Tax=Candidatus Kentrum sp. TUN TaxID=2126343 RepID=A0A450ZN89_9GAMM|nr:MAG: glutamate--cysteine ligase [Candidatus Kentron sp. TUN]VFK53354.1 MAG: glutamate--cysteine ligase [Candidatus Kentron sp. TUN]VFK55198.1 MAG: glutamate--cysteine ligase [Candidatus Kentron sp. TUN]
MKTHNCQESSNAEKIKLSFQGDAKAPGEASNRIDSTLWEQQSDIEGWISSQWEKIRTASIGEKTPRVLFYASVDLRNAGFKLAPVDTNLFPSGFNNLCASCLPECARAALTAIRRIMPTAQRLLLIPENHTRNLNYLESVVSLCDILMTAGFEVRIGSLLPNLQDSITTRLPSGRSIRLEPIVRKGHNITVADFSPCVILLNNDLAGGRPAILEDCKPIVIPPLDLGWGNRLKSEHFVQYEQVATKFADYLDFDPWLINPLFQNCGEIDFMKREGEECLAQNVNELLHQIRQKYREYHIDKQPFVFIKADAGTYGMGVMPVYKEEDIYTLNRRQRTRMSSAKGGRSVTKVILQEGVYTCESWGDTSPAIAEPVVYLIDRTVVGGFYRVHAERGETENLNAQGMWLEPVPFFSPTCNIRNSAKISPLIDSAQSSRFYAYGVVARLALLACTREMLEVDAKR